MKVYVIEKEEQRQRERVYQNLREGISQLYPEGTARVIEPLSRASSQSFLLETAHGLIWNRLFYETSRSEELEVISQQVCQLQETLGLSVTAQLLIPAALMEAWFAMEKPAGLLMELKGKKIQIFEYQILRTGAQEGMALKEWLGTQEKPSVEPLAEAPAPALAPMEAAAPSSPRVMPPPAPVLARSARLTREELRELLGLGLEVQTLRYAVS